MATPDLDALFTATERAFREVRRAAGHDLNKKKHVKEFIRERNAFHEALTSLNDELYRQKDALILPELLDEGDDSFVNASGNVSLRVTVSAHPDVIADGRIWTMWTRHCMGRRTTLPSLRCVYSPRPNEAALALPGERPFLGRTDQRHVR